MTTAVGIINPQDMPLVSLGLNPVFGSVGVVEEVDELVVLESGVVQAGTVMVVLLSTTSAFLASSLPLTVELPLSVIDVKAIIVPTKVEPVPSVAELVTCQ